jgi:hypothetical protein
MLTKRRRHLTALCASVLCASVLSAGPAAANVRYVFTSNQGSFIYDSLSFFEGGSLSAGNLTRYLGDFDSVYFGNSYILLANAACRIASDCFDATFGTSGIFQTFGTYYASDGGAEIVISEVAADAPVPEPSSWALLAVGFTGLALASTRRLRTCLRRGAEYPPVRIRQRPDASRVAGPPCSGTPHDPI